MREYIGGTKQIFYKKPYKLSFKFLKNWLVDYVGNLGYLLLMNVLRIKRKEDCKYRVSICGIFKNEERYLREWIEYHRIVGIDHFYMYDNNSTDDYMEVLKTYISQDIITLVKWEKDHDQMGAYRDCIKSYSSETEWLAFIDIDEFIVPLENDNVGEILKRFQNRPSVLIYWKMFGSGGLEKRDDDSLVTESFTVSSEKLSNTGKVFYNTKYDFLFDDKRNHLLHHMMWCSYKGRIKLPTVNIFDRVCFFFEGIAFSRGRCLMQINHYYSKSREEYFEKMGKGDVFFVDNPHTIEYWLTQEKWCDCSDYKIFKYIARLKIAMNKQ